MTRRGVIVLALVIGVVCLRAGLLLGKRRVPPCPDGRFLVRDADLIAGLAPAATDAVTVASAQVALGTACPLTWVKLRGTRKGTKAKATWPTCAGLVGKVRLKATIEPTCVVMTGTLRARKSKYRRSFTARRSECGDGAIDAGGGEECDWTKPLRGRRRASGPLRRGSASCSRRRASTPT